ncbi:glycosyltransferase [uncultured Roseobacter sp.]|uniref:glycosyltransferase n=1 Tax=uncultured Roseobacter sp. TaxID=114847 RepID=UPI002624611C|nr:glycosyltransferase [uncultured Roseobacter sp.]
MHIVVAGNDTWHYEPPPGENITWKEKAIKDHRFDLNRPHFLGHLPKPRYAKLLQRSDAHVYLTRPFVLSWSLIEAMATGCPLVVSDVAPVREVVPDPKAAQFVAADDAPAIAHAVLAHLSDPERARRMGRAARNLAKQNYDAGMCHQAIKERLVSLLSHRVSSAA